MKDRIEQLLEEVSAFKASKLDEVEQLRIKILGKKGELKELFNSFKTVAGDQKKEVGLLLNKLRNKTEEKIVELSSSFVQKEDEGDSFLDLSLPISDDNLGSRHPLSIVKNEIIEIFSRIGYSISEGPEIEDDWHNFSALNFPKEHPARDMQDTFFIDKENALRTHTSSVQVRVMENSTPPIRTISPGRVFRNEAISARAHCIFHQVEGLYIDKNVSFADLKQTLLYFAKEMFGDKTEIRLRPSYFPFTEPSAEVDVSCIICSGKGCNVCKHTGFLEILGCGMVDPNVLENCGIDSKVYTGFAFGMGVERIAMLKYQINDLRMFFENDVRFLNQFKSTI
ncbi:MAG: phenylalanine--tRNA ligase subunit alpha [Flavobacteriales bacterium]|jgi:phenylalanyl-tRNA synthetase alpha chain